MFNIDFTKLLQHLLPSFMRGKVRLAAWLAALIKPLVDLHADFIILRNRKIYEAQITGQVKYLEKLLNDTFWTAESGAVKITITDSEHEPIDVFIYNTAEHEPDTMIYNTAENLEKTYLYNASEGSAGYEFVVNIDVATVIDYDLLEALLAKYKLPGTTYTINILQ